MSITAEVDITSVIYRFEVERDPDGAGRIVFYTADHVVIDGEDYGYLNVERHGKGFAEFPIGTTFPVTINGNTVQVSGATILAALGSVAAKVLDLEEEV